MRLVRTAWGLLVASPARLVVLVAGSVAVALAASSVVLAASSSLASVRATVDAGWRGSYDILVLPPDFELRQVDGRSVVPANYLGARTGGITREQWEKVSAVPDVEVAAPVATLGWVRDVAQSVEMIPQPQLLRSEVVFQVMVIVRMGGVEAALQVFHFVGRAPSAPDPGDPVISSVDWRTDYLELGQLPAAWTQVVGVDPVQENRLVGLRSYVDGGYLTRGVGRVFDPVYEREAVNVPVLLAETATPGSLRVRVDRVRGVTPADAEVAFREALARASAAGRPIGLRRYGAAEDRVLARLVASQGELDAVIDARAPLSRFVKPLSSDLIQVTRKGRLPPPDGTGTGGCAAGRNVVLLPGYDNYEAAVHGGELRLAPVGTWSGDVQPAITKTQPGYFCAPTADLGGDEAVYRELTVDKPAQFLASQVGSYDLDRLAGEVSSAVNYVPLGVYAEAPRRLVEDAQGKPADRVLVSSPFNPGGLNPSPPTGLTNLAAVEALRGPRFIDAIRVRVGGIAGYSPQALTRIENVAGAIVERTGLQVVVVAGSSPLEVEVEVPGVGVVAERWTTLGTVAEIVNGAQGTSGVLLAASLGVALGYLLVAGVFVVVDQRQSLEVLTRLGWRRRTVRVLVGWQAAMLGAASGVLAVLALGGLRLGGAAQLPWWSLGVVLGGVLGAHVLATVVVAAAWAATRRRGGRSRGGVRRLGARPARGVTGLAWRHVVESPLRLVGVAVVVAVAVSLAAFVAAAVLAFGGRLQQTVLGELVAVRIGGYHVLAAGAAMFAAAAIALYVALLAVERRVALLGLLRALGWRARQVRRLVTVEAAAPVLAGGLLGMLTAAVIGALTGLWAAMLTVAAAGLVLTTAVAVAALRAPVAAALRMAPGITLRAEGATGAVPALATRATLAVLGVLTLGLGAATLGWSAARPTAIPAGAFITPPAPTPPSAAELRIRAYIEHLTGLGQRSPGSRALTQARDHAKEELEQAGYTVEELPYLARQLTVFDASGRRLIGADGVLLDRNLIDPQAVFPNSLAYDPDVLSELDRSYPLTLADAATTGLAGVRCTAGVVVLRIDNDTQGVLAHRLLDECGPKLAAVMTVRVPADRDWARLQPAARIRLSVERHLIATTPLPADTDTPMLVATLDSTGPGAAQSAAPLAVAVEAARSATDQGRPLDVAVIVQADGAISSFLRHQWEAQPTTPLVFLGSMGSDIAPVAGAAQPATILDAPSVRSALLSTVAADPNATGWINTTGSLLDRATSPTLLHALADHTDVRITPDYGVNLYALAVGLDAAYLGEPPTLPPGESIAGTPVDTPDQIDYPTLTRLAAGLATLPTTTITPSPVTPTATP